MKRFASILIMSFLFTAASVSAQENMTATSEEAFQLPLLGEDFPRMTVQTTHGMMTLPDDFQGQWFVLFSHPGDFTPVCTTEFVAFALMHDQFRANNTELIGLSVDQVQAHMKWIEFINQNFNVTVQFPVIADSMGDVAKRLGLIHPEKGTNTVRGVFVVDPLGKVRLILYYPQEVGRNTDEILRAVIALQMSDSNKVAMPEGWPENDIIGSNVIIPPPKDEQTAETRVTGENMTCKDWWFCYKPLPLMNATA